MIDTHWMPLPDAADAAIRDATSSESAADIAR